MGCSKSLAFGFSNVWTKGTTSDEIFHPLTGPMNSCEVHDVRPSLELRRNSGNLSCRAAFQYSDDLDTWDTAEGFGPATSATEGHHYGTSFTDLTTGAWTRRLFVRFGFICKNDTGTQMEFAQARLRIDFEGSE